MILYTASVVGFYISLVLLYISTASVLGASLLCMSILSLVLGVFFQWKEASHRGSWISPELPCVSADSPKATVSC